MLKRLSCVAAIGLLGACGVPQEKHDAVLKDLAGCRSILAKTKNNLNTVSSQFDQLKNQLAAVGGEKAALAKRLGATKQELAELRKQRALAEARARTFRNLIKRLKSMIDSGKLKVRIRKGRMIVQLADKILFDPARTKLKKAGKLALKELAAVLKDIGDRDFLVAGHTDNIPIKTRKYRSNWELSAARAVEVVKYLQSQGVDPKRLAAAGFSEYDPVGDNSTDGGRKSNRRIEIVLLPKLAELPAIPST